MNTPYSIEIRLNKTKIVGLTFMAIIFVGLGIRLMWKSAAMGVSSGYLRDLNFLVGLFGILFFGLAGILSFRKLFDKTPGLVISNEGVTENATAMSPGLVAWEDIETITELGYGRRGFINLKVRNPQYYIDRQTSFWKRKLMQMNYSWFDTAIPISTNMLDIDAYQLRTLLSEKLQEYRDNQNSPPGPGL